ncbi:MAG: carbohydrate ABC transporter permease [Ardenticatenaceae bacterium]
MKSKFTLSMHHLLGLAVALIFVLPLFWGVVASLRAPGLPPPRTVEWWPNSPSWSNYVEIFRVVPMARYTVNSLIVVAVAVPVTLITASWAAFGMVQLPNRLRQRLLIVSVALLIIPAPSVWLFRFQILRWLGLLNSLWALIIPAFAASNPLFVLLFYWTFRRIPTEVYEAARLEGASAWTIWSRIALPLSRPTIVGVVVLSFVMYWSDFINPVLYLYEPESYTLPIGLQILKQLDPTNWPLLMAAAVFMTAPVVLLFGLLQRFFLHDMSLANLFDRG